MTIKEKILARVRGEVVHTPLTKAKPSSYRTRPFVPAPANKKTSSMAQWETAELTDSELMIQPGENAEQIVYRMLRERQAPVFYTRKDGIKPFGGYELDHYYDNAKCTHVYRWRLLG